MRLSFRKPAAIAFCTHLRPCEVAERVKTMDFVFGHRAKYKETVQKYPLQIGASTFTSMERLSEVARVRM